MKLSKMVDKAVEEINCNAVIDKLDDSSKNKYGIKNVPGLVINGQIVSQGKVLSIREIKKIIISLKDSILNLFFLFFYLI